MTTLKKILIILAIIIIAAILIWQGFSWWQTKQLKIEQGLASDKFPYRDYTQEELNEMYPQIKNANVPTRTTPEQTYANFREALRTNNLEMAIEQLSKESEGYGENKKTLEEAYEEGRFKSGLENYPEKIWRSNFGEAIGSICYNQIHEDGEFVGCTNFIKDSNGDWKIDNL